MTPERRAAEDKVVADYADRILRRRAATDWPELNQAIIDRWSFTDDSAVDPNTLTAEERATALRVAERTAWPSWTSG